MTIINQPIYGEDLINKAYIDSLVEDTIPDVIYTNASKNFGSQPIPPYHINDTWTDGTNLYICIVERLIGDFDSDDWQVATSYTSDAALNTFINNTYATDKSGLQTQIDGKIETYYTSTDPNTWAVGDRTKHTGDMWYNTTDKVLKRYDGTNNKWDLIEDKKAIDAYTNAATAQDTADGKRRVFTATPTVPYDKGDLWLTSLTDSEGDIYKCINTRLTGSYTATDWVKASKYTDDTTINAFISTDYAQFVDAVDGTVMFHYQSTDPASSWDTYTKKELHVDDLWKNSSTQLSYKYTKTEGTPPTYSWELVDTSDTLFDMIDGKKSVFSAIPSTYHTNDILIIPFGAEDIPEDFMVGDIVVSVADSTTFSWSDWRKIDNYTRNTDFTTFKNSVTDNLDTITSNVNTVTEFKGTWENNLTDMKGLYNKIESSFDENGLIKEVKTTTGFTFNYDGLNISRTGEPLKLLLGYVPTEDKQDTEVGLRVSRVSDDTTMLRATEDGVTTNNLRVVTYFHAGSNTRIEDYDGGIGFFYIGS